MSNKPSSISDAITLGNEKLSAANIENFKNEVLWFLSDIINCTIANLKLNQSAILTSDQFDKFNNYLLDRASGKPFQYILGYADFYGRDFFVDENTLIPRPETEIIIDKVCKKHDKHSLLEIGTGSGCISITIALETSINRITSIDISNKSLKVAKKNSEKYNINNINFINHDFFDKKKLNTFDLIISNPPYIDINDYNNLDNHVRNYEPQIALTDYSDGLSFYRQFALIGKHIMHDDSIMLLEFGGKNQLDDIKKIFCNYNYNIHLDLQNDPRVIEINL